MSALWLGICDRRQNGSPTALLGAAGKASPTPSTPTWRCWLRCAWTRTGFRRRAPTATGKRCASCSAQLKKDTALVNQLRHAVEAASADDGWAPLASVGHILTGQSPDFDSRTYGYAKLSDLIAATTLFELGRRSPGDGKPEIMYVRDKRRRRGRKPRSTPTAPRARTA